MNKNNYYNNNNNNDDYDADDDNDYFLTDQFLSTVYNLPEQILGCIPLG